MLIIIADVEKLSFLLTTKKNLLRLISRVV